MKKLFYLLKRLAFFLRIHFVAIILGSAAIFAVLGVGARLLFPEWFIPRYDVEFSGDPSRPREKINPYTVQNGVAPDALAKYLSQELTLSETTQGGDTYFDPLTETSVSRAPDNSGTQYTDPTAAPDEGESLLPLDTAEQAARQFLLGLGYPKELKLVQVGYQRIDGMHIEEATEETATAYKLSFVPSLSELPVSSSTGTNHEIDVSVSAKGVFKAFLPPLVFSATQLQEQTVLSVEAALNQLSLGAFTSSQVTPDAQKTGSFSLTTRELVYRLENGSQQIVPMYKFTGTYTNALGKSQDVEVYVKAIE